MNKPFSFGSESLNFNLQPEFESIYETSRMGSCPPYTPTAVEQPGGGRIKNKKIPDSTDIIVIQGAFGKTPLRRVTAAALKALVCAARADGIKHPQLLPTGGKSGFRDPIRQKAAWERALRRYGSAQEAVKWVARPGFSAHQSGRAIDFYLGVPNDSRNVARLRQTPAYKWMVANARRFGFYPYEREPWHWEYNPSASRQGEVFGYQNELVFENGSALDVLSPSELKAVKITSTFETGRPGGFGGLTGNFDGQGLSFGLLNSTIKAGSLIPLLQEFISKYPARYSAAFGKDADRFKEIVFATKPDQKNPERRVRDVARQMEFVNKQMNLVPKKAKGNKIIEPWKTYFGRLENDPEFRKIQVKAVRRALDRARYWFNYFGFKTERGFAFMFDLVSSHGGAWLNAPKFKGKRRELLQKMLAAKKAELRRTTLTERETMSVIANMIADASLPEWREKARIRKLWFVQGIGKVHGHVFNIAKDFGITDNPPKFGGTSPELAWEMTYGEQEYEAPGVASSPALLKSEKSALGETLYVKIGIGRGLPAVTGIFIPNSFKPDGNSVAVVYLHGHKGLYPGNKALIDGYWNGTRFPFFGLREEVSASGQNAIFIAPSLGSLSQAGNLTAKGGFDAFMKQVLSGLNKHFLTPRYGRQMADFQTIILAAHSGGGAPMFKIANGTDRYTTKIKECWGFDSMYGWVAPAWIAWLKSHPKKNLYAYYGPAKKYFDPKLGRERILPRDNAEAIACSGQKQRLTNVCVQPSRAKTVGKVGAHFWVPKIHLRERLLNTPCSARYVCPSRVPGGKKRRGPGEFEGERDLEFTDQEIHSELTRQGPKTVWRHNTDLDAPYFGGNFSFLYNGGANQAVITFNTYLAYRKGFSEAEKRSFVNNLKDAVGIWDSAAEVQVKDINGNYVDKIKLRFKLNFVRDAKNANKKTDVHPTAGRSAWFMVDKDRETVMRDLNVFIGSTRNVLVHELGHVWGLLDEYDTRWIEKKLSVGHVGTGSPLLKDKTAIMNEGFWNDSGEFRGRYFKHFGRAILNAFWGLKNYEIPIKHNGKIVSRSIQGRIVLSKKSIAGAAPYASDMPPFNPVSTAIAVTKR